VSVVLPPRSEALGRHDNAIQAAHPDVLAVRATQDERNLRPTFRSTSQTTSDHPRGPNQRLKQLGLGECVKKVAWRLETSRQDNLTAAGRSYLQRHRNQARAL
jgi:hypothetical protein